MNTKLHPDLNHILQARGLNIPNPQLEVNVGRVIRFKPPQAEGSAALMYTFTIIGTQKDYRGESVYRALCNGYKDTFGCCASPDEIEFIS